MGLTSISMFIRKTATTALGLALSRKYFAHHCRNRWSSAIDGAQYSSMYGPPQFCRQPSNQASVSRAPGLRPQG
jgi:hypothetical protein